MKYFIEIFLSQIREMFTTREKSALSALLAQKEVMEKDLLPERSIYDKNYVKTYVS